MGTVSYKFLERIQLTFELSFLKICHSVTLYVKHSIARHCVDGNIMWRMRLKNLDYEG